MCEGGGARRGLRAHLIKDLLHAGAVDAVGLEVHEQQVVLRATRHDGVAVLLQAAAQSAGVGEHRELVLLELWGHRLLEGDAEAGDGVVVRASLQTAPATSGGRGPRRAHRGQP